MQNKPLLFGLLAGAVGLWILLSWDPVAREEFDDAVVEHTEVPEEPPAATPVVAAPAEPAPKPTQEPAVEPAPTPEETTEEALEGEPPSGIQLVHAPKEDVDMANLPPPSASGPLKALEEEFESGARDAQSSQLEDKIGEAFKSQHVPPELLESAVCHGSTCLVRTRWTPERAGGFMIAFTTLAVQTVGEDGTTPIFERNFAIGQASERNSNGERSIDVYLRKRPSSPEQPKP